MAPRKRKHSLPARTNRLTRKTGGEAEGLLAKIRRLAIQQRKDRPQVFLSLREAARRFGAPVSAIAGIYAQLTEEGVLAGIRGSRTMLQPRGSMRSLKTRGVIGMPVSVWRFQSLMDYQSCFRRIRDELHERGFLTNTVFFEHPENQLESAIERFKREKIDTALWLLPDGANSETVLRLRDAGIRFVGLNITPLAGMECRYEIRRQPAIRAIARSWRADPKIAGATIVRVGGEIATDEERLQKLRALIESEKIECQIATLRDGRISTFLKTLCANRSGGVILPAAAAALLGWRAPETLNDVFSSCRIALIDGPMYLPFADAAPLATVDIVTANWGPIAERVVDDLLTGEAYVASTRVTFEAKPHLRVLLGDFAHAS